MLFCREPKMKSPSVLVRVDEKPELHTWKGGRRNGHVEGSSQPLRDCPPGGSVPLSPRVPVRVREYGEQEKRKNERV